MKRILVLVLMVSLFVFNGFASVVSEVKVTLDTAAAITTSAKAGISDDISILLSTDTPTTDPSDMDISDKSDTKYIWWIIEAGSELSTTITLTSTNNKLVCNGVDNGEIAYTAKFGTAITGSDNSCSLDGGIPTEDIIASAKSFKVKNSNNKSYGYLDFTATVTDEEILKAHTGEIYSDTLTVTITTEASGT